MQIVDRLTLDPVDFLPNGAELDLTAAGFQILDADFGDADVDLEMMRQALGETPTSYHPPNTVTTLKLSVRKEGEVDLPTAAHELAQKIGEINTPGTEHWLRRDFDYKAEGEFAGSLGKRVYKATLSGLGGWQRGNSPDVTLTLVTGPYWYMTSEAESEVFESAEGARELIGTIAKTLGTAPGLIRFRITNLGEDDWRGLIFAAECRDHPQDETADTTAALAYDAADLTAKGGSAEAEREGEKVLRHSELTRGWLTICDSEITVEELGYWTHKGVRRPWMRIWDPGSEAGDVQLKARWRPLGSLQWSENRIVPTPLVDDWALIDLGEARPEPAALGDERWQLQIQARAVSGAGAIDLQRIYPLPTEQFMVLKAPGISQAADLQSSKSPGEAATSGGSGGPWSSPNNVKSSDDAWATAPLEEVKTPVIIWMSESLEIKKFGFVIPEEATITGVIAEVERSAEGYVQDRSVKLLNGTGLAQNRHKTEHWQTDADSVAIYGSASDLWGVTLTPAQVMSNAFGVSISCQGSPPATAQVDYVRLTVYYAEAADENRVCFATRKIESRTDGVFRQASEDDVWGELIPEGFLPYGAPSGLEGRKSRFIVIPTQGDLGELADSGDNPLSAQALTRAAYHVAREAA